MVFAKKECCTSARVNHILRVTKPNTKRDPHAASGGRIHCGVEATELSTNKQHSLSSYDYLSQFAIPNWGMGSAF
jgi:hypothetical protein